MRFFLLTINYVYYNKYLSFNNLSLALILSMILVNTKVVELHVSITIHINGRTSRLSHVQRNETRSSKDHSFYNSWWVLGNLATITTQGSYTRRICFEFCEYFCKETGITV